MWEEVAKEAVKEAEKLEMKEGGGGGEEKEADKEGVWIGMKQRKRKVRTAPSMGTYNSATMVLSLWFHPFCTGRIFCQNCMPK